MFTLNTWDVNIITFVVRNYISSFILWDRKSIIETRGELALMLYLMNHHNHHQFSSKKKYFSAPLCRMSLFKVAQ